jgi:eukaryotic-like serine/threonine-protein kinase
MHRFLGCGGFGNTYEVSDNGTPKVLKVLTETHPKAIELFQQEALVLSQLQSSGIPKVEQDSYFTITPVRSSVLLHCLVMEKIEGVDLQQWMVLKHYQPISQQKALDWLKQLVAILDLVHAKQYFHRDIKPHNIMLRPSGKLVLIDFGAVRQVTTTILAGNCHTKIFSEGYSPPEQQNGYSMPQSDFFALGRTFVFLLTGKEPHDPSIYDPLINKLHWHHYATHISPLLLDIIDCLMAPTASQRPKNTQIIKQQLLEFEEALRHPLAQPHYTPTKQNAAPITHSKFSRLPTSVIAKSNTSAKNPQKNQPWKILFGLGIGGIVVSAAGFSLFSNNKHIANPVVVKTSQDVASPTTTPIATSSPQTDSITSISRLSTPNITPTPSFNNDASNPESVKASTRILERKVPTNEVSSFSTPVLDKPTPTSDTSVASVVQPTKPSFPSVAQTSRPTVEEKRVTFLTPQPTLSYTNTKQTKITNASIPVANAPPNQQPKVAKTPEESKLFRERKQNLKPKVVIPAKPQIQTKATNSKKLQPTVVRTAKPTQPINQQPKTIAKPRKVWKPPPPKQLSTSNPNPGLVDAAKPWESKAPLKSVSDELEDIIRGDKND